MGTHSIKLTKKTFKETIEEIGLQLPFFFKDKINRHYKITDENSMTCYSDFSEYAKSISISRPELPGLYEEITENEYNEYRKQVDNYIVSRMNYK